MELFRDVGTSFEAVFATCEKPKQDPSDEGGATFSGKIAELERHKLLLMQELCQSERLVEQSEKEIGRLRTMILALEQDDVQKMELINQYRNITVKSLEDANSAYETYRLSALSSKGGRG